MVDRSAYEPYGEKVVVEGRAEPFAVALRAAIQASGLSLDRIQYRLRRRGIPISVTALSYWQLGRRRPERAESLAAVRYLEGVLGVAEGSLTGLLAPPRPRGRVSRSQKRVPLDALWSADRASVSSLLEQVDVCTDIGLVPISHHDRVTVAADRGVRSLAVRQVLRAERDGVDRSVIVIDVEAGSTPLPEPVAIRACRFGRVARDEQAGFLIGELLFDRPLRNRETVVIEYALRFPGPPYPQDNDTQCRKFMELIREYLIEVRFDPGMLPTRIEQFALRTGEEVASRRGLVIEPAGDAHAVALDFGPGTFGMRWEWE
jgi:hypothetical protein